MGDNNSDNRDKQDRIPNDNQEVDVKLVQKKKDFLEYRYQAEAKIQLLV